MFPQLRAGGEAVTSFVTVVAIVAVVNVVACVAVVTAGRHPVKV